VLNGPFSEGSFGIAFTFGVFLSAMSLLPHKGLLAIAAVVDVALQSDGRPISGKTLVRARRRVERPRARCETVGRAFRKAHATLKVGAPLDARGIIAARLHASVRLPTNASGSSRDAPTKNKS
jgi:hypothetical protein